MNTTEVKNPQAKVGTLAQADTPPQYTSQNSGRVTKINWTAAKEYYLSDPKITLHKVAEKFDITYKSVQKWAAQEKWILQRKNNAMEQGLETAKQRREETVEQINTRHIELYLQMQGFIKTNIAIAQDYVREEYLEAKRANKAVNKQKMFSAQNVKYLMEALKISVDGERVAEGISITGPTKSEKDIRVSATASKYDAKQLEAMFGVTKTIVKDMEVTAKREVIEAETLDGW